MFISKLGFEDPLLMVHNLNILNHCALVVLWNPIGVSVFTMCVCVLPDPWKHMSVGGKKRA